MIAITIDTDWAPPEVIRFTTDLIHSYRCKVTAFVTDNVDVQADEICIHPNFTDINDLNTPISKLKEIFPTADGIRSHSLFFSERLRPYYTLNNIKFDSNSMQYFNLGIRCSMIAKNTLSIPIYFMDRFHLEMASDDPDRFSIEQFNLDVDSLKVFDFHPIHVFLNTDSIESYNRAKEYYHQPKLLRRYINPGKGIMTLLVSMLSYIKDNNIPTYTMSEIGLYHKKILGVGC